jgi:hypothetical protein
MKKSSEETAKFTIGAYCDWDKRIIAIYNFANDTVCSEGESCEIVCPTILPSKLLFFSISPAQIRFSKLSSFRGGANRGSGSMDNCDIKADA